MASEPTLRDELAALAAEERARSGEPPWAEELIAFRDGTLAPEDAERVRDRLAVDPEWAAIYLELAGADEAAVPELAAPGQDPEVDDAWRELAAELEPSAARAKGADVVPLRRPRLARFVLGLAAAAVLAVGVAWLVGRDDLEPRAGYQTLRLTGAQYRGAELRVPRDFAGLELAIDVSERQSGERLTIELLDATERLVERWERTVPATRELKLPVPAEKLVEDVGYTVVVRREGAPDPFWREAFRLRFED